MSDTPPPRSPRRRRSDPLGKRALFVSPPVVDAPAGTGGGAVRDRVEIGHGPLRVECERCGVVTRTNLVEVLFCHFPIGFWLPGRRFDHRMTCPACSRWVWAGITLSPRSDRPARSS